MKYKLSDLCKIKYGKDYKKLGKGHIPVFGSGGLMTKVNNYIYDGPSVLIPRKGSLNNIQYVKDKFWTVDTLFWTVIDAKKIEPKFLFYILKRINFSSYNVGTAIPSLTIPIISNIVINVPSLTNQRRILSIINPIDSKITLNKKLSNNLFDLSHNLFNKFCMNSNNKVKLSDITDIQNGYAFKSTEYIDNKELLVLRTKNIDNNLFSKHDARYISKDNISKYQKYEFNLYDTALAMVGSLGKIGFLTSNVLPSLQNQNMWRFRPKIDVPGLYLYEVVNYINKKLISSASGSVRQFYKKDIFQTANIPLINKQHYKIFTNLENKINEIALENEYFVQLRTNILYKLF